MADDILILVMAFGGSFCFGLTSVILKLGVENQNIFTALFIRIIGSAPFLLILNFLLFGLVFFTSFLPLDIISLVVLASMLMVAGDLILMFTLKSKPVGLVIPVAATNPLFTTLLLLITGEETVSLEILLLTFFIILGILLVTYEQPNADKNLNQIFDLHAIAAGLIIAILWGLMIFIEISILKHENIIGISYSAMKIFSLSLIVSLALIFSRNLGNLQSSFADTRSVSYLFFAGFVGWVLGATLVYTSFDLGSAVTINLIIGLNPIFAVIVSLVLKMESFSKLKFIGMALCIFSSILLVI
ncbi:MAG: EamA family transporter [Candidatus Hodarchaeales archaeon]